MQVGVEWENVNMLDIATILAMAEDGYAFGISDGRIQCVVLTINMFQYIREGGGHVLSG